jgi:Domain of unknown function (DUF1707)
MDDRQRMRASDQDRQQVVDLLRVALENGRLTMDEYLDRMGLAYQAMTYGDLARLYADLPAAGRVLPGRRAPQPIGRASALASDAPQATGPVRRGGLAGLPLALRVLWTIWLTAVSVNVVVWVLVSGGSGHLAYPWPLWVAGPYGAVLFALSAAVTQFRRARPAGQRAA